MSRSRWVTFLELRNPNVILPGRHASSSRMSWISWSLPSWVAHRTVEDMSSQTPFVVAFHFGRSLVALNSSKFGCIPFYHIYWVHSHTPPRSPPSMLHWIPGIQSQNDEPSMHPWSPASKSNFNYLLNQLLSPTHCHLYLLRIYHLGAGEVKDGIMSRQHSGDWPVAVAIVQVVVSCSQLCCMAVVLVPPVYASYLRRKSWQCTKQVWLMVWRRCASTCTCLGDDLDFAT